MHWLVKIKYITSYNNSLEQEVLVRGTKQEVMKIIFDHFRNIRSLTPLSIRTDHLQPEEWKMLEKKGCPIWE